MSVFSKVASLRPGRSVFNLSHDVKLTCDMGQLIPVLAQEVVPGDTFKIGVEAVIRFQPLVAPVLHEINAFFHYFFVPYRILWADWEKFITGDVLGDDTSTLPRWNPTGFETQGYLWDYFGMPLGVVPTGALPMSFPRDAYNMIYNNYYRDETLIAEVALTNEEPLYRAWQKDYFTSALPWQQRGTAPALPITGVTSAEWELADFGTGTGTAGAGWSPIGGNPTFQVGGTNERQEALDHFNDNVVDLSSASTFDVSDLRLAFQIQKWQERNARAGVRYTEWLKAHFGRSPRDERLQRPEYLGGTKMPVMVSEVLQTSSTDAVSSQGNMAGHGLVAGRDFCAGYTADEFGIIIGIMSVMPKPTYQQGIERQWLRVTRFDFYHPEFAHLSEQAVIRAEVFANGVSGDNNTIFGYQGRYNEMRTGKSRVANLMNSSAVGSLDFWHLARDFASAPGLNQTFIDCVPDKRIFAAPSEPGLICNVANIVKAIRPLPIEAAPGLIDHA